MANSKDYRIFGVDCCCGLTFKSLLSQISYIGLLRTKLERLLVNILRIDGDIGIEVVP